MAKRKKALLGALKGSTSNLQPNEGEWCRYCPAFASCPSKRALFSEAIAGPVPVTTPTIAELTPELASAAWRRLDLIEMLTKRARSILRQYAAENPFPTSSGQVLGKKVCRKEVVVPELLEQSLSPEFGPEVAAAVAADALTQKVDCTKNKLKAALRVHALPTLDNPKKRGAIKELENRAFGAIRKANGFSVKVSTPVIEHMPKLELAAGDDEGPEEEAA
jgi:hypothetical protein